MLHTSVPSFPQRYALGLLLALTPLGQVGIDLYTPSFPGMVDYFSTSASAIQATVTVYLVAIGIGQLLYGPLSDSYGRRPAVLLGIILFFVGSLMALLAPTIEWFLLARFIQGLGGAAATVLAKIINIDVFQGHDQIRVSSLIGLVWGASPIVAPTIGGYLDVAGGWIACFVALACYALGLLVVCYRWLPETRRQRQPWQGATLFQHSIGLFRHPIFLSCMVLTGLGNTNLMVFNTMAPFLIQDVLGYDPIFYGYMALLAGLAFMVGSVSNTWLVRHVSSVQVIAAGVLITGLATAFMTVSHLLLPPSLWLLLLASFLIIFGAGLQYPNLAVRIFQPFPGIAGLVSSCYGLGSYGISAMVTAVIVSLPAPTPLMQAVLHLCLSLLAVSVAAKAALLPGQGQQADISFASDK